jgi:hypothetical protein
MLEASVDERRQNIGSVRSWKRGERKTQSTKTNREWVCKLFKTFVERIQIMDWWQKKSKVSMGVS